MKMIRLLLVTFGLLLFAGACNCDSKADTWDNDQKAKWTKSCMTFMETKGVEEKNAVDFCDCMLEKTSEKYTPEEAANITEDEERKLWESCDYDW
jgi:hypothetical protein